MAAQLALQGLLSRFGIPATWAVHAQYAATAVIGLVVLWVLQGFRKASTSRLPGPATWFLFGNLLSLANSTTRSNVILSWANKFGGIFRLWVFRTPYIVITDPALAHELMVDHSAHLSKPRGYCSSIAQMLPGSQSSLLSSTACDDTWRASRKCLVHSFSLPEVALDGEVARGKALQLVEVLASLGPGVAVNMADATTRLSLDVFGLAKLGYDFGAVETPEDVMLLRLLRECSAEWAKRRAFPLRPWLSWFSDSVAEGRHKFMILQDFIRTLWAGVRAQGPPAEDDLSLAAQLQRLRDPRTAAVVPDSVLVAELAGQLIAGHEALGHGLAWCLYLLAAHGQDQEQLHAELLESGCVDEPTLLTIEALANLPCLDRVVRESLRLYPTWGEGLVRCTTAAIQLGGGAHTIPKGSCVWVHTYAMQRSDRNWIDGGLFQPDRWQHDSPQQPPQAAADPATDAPQATGYDGFASCSDVAEAAKFMTVLDSAAVPGNGAGDTKAKEVQKATADAGSGKPTAGPQRCAHAAFMPFGVGPRGCLGQGFAQVHLKICLAILISYFKFELSGDPSLCAATAGLTLGPQNEGLPLILSIRYPEMFQG